MVLKWDTDFVQSCRIYEKLKITNRKHTFHSHCNKIDNSPYRSHQNSEQCLVSLVTGNDTGNEGISYV